MFGELTDKQLKKLWDHLAATKDGKPLDRLAATFLVLMGFELENELARRGKESKS